MSTHINPLAFYEQYSGHPTSSLQQLTDGLREQDKRIMWLAGDSSLDNKHWLFQGSCKTDRKHLHKLFQPAVSGYEKLFLPPKMLPDVAFCINSHLEDTGVSDMTCVNAAVEATTLAQRQRGLTPQDCIIRDQMQPEDVLVVSIGGNDVALAPTPDTLHHVAGLLSKAPGSKEHQAAVEHFMRLFKHDVEQYVNDLVAKTKPAVVAVCMIYFPAEDNRQNSWCGSSLERMGYNSQPWLLQTAIQQMFHLATSSIAISGVEKVVHVPLFQALDGKQPSHYHHRVEPSILGGKHMARIISQHTVLLDEEADFSRRKRRMMNEDDEEYDAEEADSSHFTPEPEDYRVEREETSRVILECD